MKTWLVGGAVVACGVGVYVTTRSPQEVTAPAAPSHVTPRTVAPAPAAIPDVVNVANIDHLLDPPSIPVADSDAPPSPVVVSVSADHVPAPRAAAPVALPRAAD